MDSWPPQYDKNSTMYSSWDMIMDIEYQSIEKLTNTTEEAVGGSKVKNENKTVNTECKQDKAELFIVGGDLNKNDTEKIEQNVDKNYQRFINKNEINPSCDNSSAAADSKVQSATAIHSYGGTRHKISVDPRMNANTYHVKVCGDKVTVDQRASGRNARKEGKYYFSNISSNNKSDVVKDKDIILTFNMDAVDEMTTSVTKTSVKTTNKIENDAVQKITQPNQSYFDYRISDSTKQSHQVISDDIKKPANEQLSYNVLIKDPHIKTLGDSLRYFKLYSHLQLLETALEDIRRNKYSKEKHKSDVKQFDKQIQKLSFKFHPDKVRNRGGSEEEMAIAQKLQTALNSTRTVLNILSEAFLEDISTDHKYEYYTNLNINSLGNEDEVKNHICKVLFKISFISEIKQQNIIAEIRNFLVESKSCVKHFFEDNVNEFEKSRNSALFHLKKCIKGYKKLLSEFKVVEEECKLEKSDNINTLLKKMSSACSRNLYFLKEIKKTAKKSLSGACLFYSTSEYLDDYFVLPFANYINVIILCNVMLKDTSQTFWGNFRNSHQEPVYNHATSFLVYLYYLASFFSGNKQYKNIVERTLREKSLHTEHIKDEFRNCLQQLNKYMEDKFRIDYYAEKNHGNHLMQEYMKCMKMMADFKMKEKELKNDIKKLASRNQEIENKFDQAMKESEELSNKVNERLEQSKLLREKISASFSKA